MQAPSPQSILSEVPTGIFHAGNWVGATLGNTFTVFDPATEKPLLEVADATGEDAVAALDANVEAAAAWSATSPQERADLLWAAWDKLNQQREFFANLITFELGKPLEQSDGEVTYGGSFLRWFAEGATHINGRYNVLPQGNLRSLVTHRPVGPSLLVTPWNFPLAMATRKIAPALAAGCTVIVKPAQLTPLTTLAFTKILQEVGVPAGVVEVLPTSSAKSVTQPLLRDPRLRKLSFTGSTQVGQTLLREAAPGVLRTSMELGGLAPFIVFEDADLDQAVAAALATKMRNMGQACNASSRFYVHESLYQDFLERFTQGIAAMKVGNGREPGVEVGPLVSARHREDVDALVRQSISEGAQVRLGGHPLPGPGYFYAPTVLEVAPDNVLMKEEVFGPVAPVCSFQTDEQVLKWANDTSYGLAGYAYTANIDRALSLSRRLEVGMISVNAGTNSNAAAPFGGVKASGLGREGGDEGIFEYLEPVYLTLPN